MKKYMMATTAIHQSGDISSTKPDLCIVTSEDNDNYIGNWVFGFGFFDVKFPKSTTRDLTSDEIEKFHGECWFINNNLHGIINLTGETYDMPCTLVKSDNSKIYTGIIITPIKIGKSIGMILDNGGWITTSKVINVDGNTIQTKNSTYSIIR